MNIPIVPLEWVYDSIQDKELKDPAEYPLRLFEGMVVSTTGFNNGIFILFLLSRRTICDAGGARAAWRRV